MATPDEKLINELTLLAQNAEVANHDPDEDPDGYNAGHVDASQHMARQLRKILADHTEDATEPAS